jgi:hypothetical protein
MPTSLILFGFWDSSKRPYTEDIKKGIVGKVDIYMVIPGKAQPK